MPGCSAIGCNNRSEKGFTMKCFPRDPKLRNIWKERVGRAEWEPSNNSFLCHAHFESDQWLVSLNGKIKLRKGAVPSIFHVTSTRKSTRKKLGSGVQIIEEDDLGEYEMEYLDNDAPLLFNTNNLKKLTGNVNVPDKKPATKHTQVLDNIKIINSNENIILITNESNKQLQKLINGDNIILIEKEKENMKSISENNKSKLQEALEIKKEISENRLQAPDYDEIERRLQEMCDSENEVEELNAKEKTSKNDILESPKKSSKEESVSNMQVVGKGIKRKRSVHLEYPKKHVVKESSQTLSMENQSRYIEHSSGIIINHLEDQGTIEYIIPNELSDTNIEQNKNKPIITKDIHVIHENGKEVVPQSFKINTTDNSKQNIHDSTGVNNQKQIENLNSKLNVQSEVIENLTHQLIMYKDMEKKLHAMSQKFQQQKKENDILIQKVHAKKLPLDRKYKNDSFDLKNANEEDLKNRIELLEEKNRNLNKSIALEDQNRKKLECQVRSKDNQIKELNWKLEKASKFLDRAEKNTNNYKRKLQSVQSQLKRKKYTNGKNNTPFDELLLCQTNQSYSTKAFTIALDIEKNCGSDGYKKLLSFQFPLPTLKELSTVCHESGEEEEEMVEGRNFIDDAYEESMIEIKMENVQYLDPDLVSEPDEDVAGTVQDIFNESSDQEDLNLNELEKHIKLNLSDKS